MASWRKITVLGTCVLAASGALTLWWVHWRATEKRVAEASAIRLRAERGNAKAQKTLASMYYYGLGAPQNYGQAAHWYRMAAEQGDARAQFGLGSMYDDGKGVPEDHARAVGWYRRAAEQGNVKAESALGHAYYSGQGISQDYVEAARWYRQAAGQGYALAQEVLGYMYAHGRGVPRDDVQAVAWYRKAAEQGDAEAERSLGYMYAVGQGVPKDRGLAIRWYLKAAQQGDSYAKSALASLGYPPSPPETIRYVEVFAALMALGGGLLFLWLPLSARLRGARPWSQRQSIEVLLGSILLVNSGLSWHASGRDVRFSPHAVIYFSVWSVFIVAAVVLLVGAVLWPSKRKGDRSRA